MKPEGYAIVTGASRGLGKAAAMQLAEDGYNVVINYVSERGQKHIRQTAEEIKAKCGVDVLVVRTDVAEYEGCKKIIDAAVEKFGEKIAILVNNAGIGVSHPFATATPEEMQRMINVNLMSQLYLSKLAYPYMAENGGGHIINVASNAGIMGVEGFIDYSASKGGVIAMTKAMAKELAGLNIQVNCIAPGCILSDLVTDSTPENIERLTNLTPLKRLGELSEMAILVHYIISSDFLTGQVISPNGGWTI